MSKKDTKEIESIMYDFEIAFTNNPETYTIKNAVMTFEDNMIRFTIYEDHNIVMTDLWYPMCNIARIERFYEEA